MELTYAKQKNVAKARKPVDGAGDTWTWTGLDADSKLIVSWLVSTRDAGSAYTFVSDLADRLANRIQLTSDGLKLYLGAVEDAVAGNIDYSMLVNHRRERDALQPSEVPWLHPPADHRRPGAASRRSITGGTASRSSGGWRPRRSILSRDCDASRTSERCPGCGQHSRDRSRERRSRRRKPEGRLPNFNYEWH